MVNNGNLKPKFGVFLNIFGLILFKFLMYGIFLILLVKIIFKLKTSFLPLHFGD